MTVGIGLDKFAATFVALRIPSDLAIGADVSTASGRRTLEPSGGFTLKILGGFFCF